MAMALRFDWVPRETGSNIQLAKTCLLGFFLGETFRPMVLDALSLSV